MLLETGEVIELDFLHRGIELLSRGEGSIRNNRVHFGTRRSWQRNVYLFLSRCFGTKDSQYFLVT